MQYESQINRVTFQLRSLINIYHKDPCIVIGAPRSSLPLYAGYLEGSLSDVLTVQLGDQCS